MKSLLGNSIEIDTFSTVTSVPGAVDQAWHMDVDHAFRQPAKRRQGCQLKPQSLVAIAPLVNMTTENGATEFHMGSHVDLVGLPSKSSCLCGCRGTGAHHPAHCGQGNDHWEDGQNPKGTSINLELPANRCMSSPRNRYCGKKGGLEKPKWPVLIHVISHARTCPRARVPTDTAVLRAGARWFCLTFECGTAERRTSQTISERSCT